jgi:hypothetical protein
MRPDWKKLKKIQSLTKTCFKCLDLDDKASWEKALFGIVSLQGTITVDAGEIVWDNREDYSQVMSDIEENGPEYYDTDTPLIVDLDYDGSLLLNDGHHRYLVGTEFSPQGRFSVEVQISLPIVVHYLHAVHSKRFTVER